MAVPTFIQSNGGDAGGTFTCEVAFPSPNTAGNFIALAIWGGTLATLEVSDSAGNDYTPSGPTLNPGGSLRSSSIYYAQDIAASASNTVTVTLTSFDFLNVAIQEYSGIVTTGSPIDVQTTATGTGTAMAAGPIVTTGSNDLVFASFDAVGANGSVNEPLAQRENLGFGSWLSADLIQATPGSVAVGGVCGNGQWSVYLVAFKAAGLIQPTFFSLNS